MDQDVTHPAGSKCHPSIRLHSEGPLAQPCRRDFLSGVVRAAARWKSHPESALQVHGLRPLPASGARLLGAPSILSQALRAITSETGWAAIPPRISDRPPPSYDLRVVAPPRMKPSPVAGFIATSPENIALEVGGSNGHRIRISPTSSTAAKLGCKRPTRPDGSRAVTSRHSTALGRIGSAGPCHFAKPIASYPFHVSRR